MMVPYQGRLHSHVPFIGRKTLTREIMIFMGILEHGWNICLPPFGLEGYAWHLARGAHRALCPRCAKSRLFFTTGSHGSQGPQFCTLQPLLVHQGFFVLVWCLPRVPGSRIVHPQCRFEWIMHAPVGGWFSGVLLG